MLHDFKINKYHITGISKIRKRKVSGYKVLKNKSIMLYGFKINKYITRISKENKSIMFQSFEEKQKYVTWA